MEENVDPKNKFDNEKDLKFKNKNIGKFKRILDVLCPECTESNLQLRVLKENAIVDGEEITIDKELQYCVSCGYINFNKNKKKNKKNYELEEDDQYGESHRKRIRTHNRNAKNSRNSYK